MIDTPAFHSSGDPPTHPLTGSIMHHVDQFRSLTVRIKPDAHITYSTDKRWDEANDDEKVFAIKLLSKIAGGCYPVMSMEKEEIGTFYNIRISPKIRASDVFGVPMDVGAAFIPTDYCDTIMSGCPEAR